MSNISEFPLVTIAIPTYNQSWCISDAIESALAQDYPNLEIVIADDFSTEDIYEVVKLYKMDSRIKYFKNEKNIGRAGNYKRCLYTYAKGDWYLNLDGDDILTDAKYITNAISYINKNKNIVLATAACLRVTDNVIDYKITSNYAKDVCIVSGKEFFLDIPSQKAWISHLTSLYNRKKALSLNFYKENILSTDYESLFRLLLTGDVLVFKEVAGIWRIHDKNESRSFLKTPQRIINNFKYVENAAAFAKDFIDTAQIKLWKAKILKAQILAFSLQFLLNKPIKYVSFVIPMSLKYPTITISAQFKVFGRAIKKLFKKNTR